MAPIGMSFGGHSHRGRLIKSGQETILAIFEAPGQAIRCAAAVRDHAATLGIQIRAGIQTGEVDLVGDDTTGTSMHITDDVAALAQPGEILVSRTVKDLVAGSFSCAGRSQWPTQSRPGLGASPSLHAD
jgi:class 3 adenylate cyclase